MLRILFLILVSLLLFFLPFTHTEILAQSKLLVITHVTLINGTGEQPQNNMSVVVQGNRIIRIGNTGRVRVPTDAEIIDGTGKFLIPGLWDMHIHSGGYQNGRKFLPNLLANGITGVRDMGSPLDESLRLRNEITEGKISGPRMFIAGPIVQGPLPFRMPLLISVHNETEVRDTIESLKQNRVDFIKVQDALPRDLYFALAREASRQKISFAGHVPPSVSAAEVANAGQQSIEHLGGRFYGVMIGCSEQESELAGKVREIIERVLRQLKEGKEPDDSEIFRASFLKPLVESHSDRKAASLISTFRKNKTWQVPTLIAQPLRQKIYSRNELSGEDLLYGKALLQKQFDLVKAMQRAGVKIMAGTDLPLQELKLVEELNLLVEAGLTSMQALQSATRNPAEFLGRLDSLGTVEPGKIADFVLLDADPLVDIRNVRKVYLVVANGKVIQRSAN